MRKFIGGYFAVFGAFETSHNKKNVLGAIEAVSKWLEPYPA